MTGQVGEDLERQVVEWRRHLHRHPEPSFEERDTAAFVAETLAGFGDALTIERPTETSVVARLDSGRPGPVVALRADIDALRVHEESGVDFASERPGAMHACGHDGHTAMLLGAARTLAGSGCRAARCASSSSTPRRPRRAARATWWPPACSTAST